MAVGVSEEPANSQGESRSGGGERGGSSGGHAGNGFGEAHEDLQGAVGVVLGHMDPLPHRPRPVWVAGQELCVRNSGVVHEDVPYRGETEEPVPARGADECRQVHAEMITVELSGFVKPLEDAALALERDSRSVCDAASRHCVARRCFAWRHLIVI